MKSKPAPRPLDRLAIRAATWAREKANELRVRREIKAAAKEQG